MARSQRQHAFRTRFRANAIPRIGWYLTLFVVISWPLYLRDVRLNQSQAAFLSPIPVDSGNIVPLDFNLTLLTLDELQEVIENVIESDRFANQMDRRARILPKVQLHEGRSKIKGAHLFSDSSPITFWEDFREEKVRHDLEQIINDGFNTVIIVFPWAGMQVNAHENLYDPWMYKRIVRLLSMIDEAGLFFVNRVGYTHNLRADNTPKGGSRCSYVMLDQDANLQSWKEYLKSLEFIFARFDGYLYSFFSWEDFFCGKSMMESSEKERVKYGLASKFNYSVPINDGTNPEQVRLWYNHIILKWLQMLARGQSVMRKLTMEIRVDSDPVFLAGDDIEWFGYNEAGRVPDGARVATYFSPYFGQENEGVAVEAEDVAAKLEFMLKEVVEKRFGVKGSLLNQFNFVDNTPGFLKTSNFIPDHKVVDFLHKVAPILQNLTSGYALWAYTNYRESYIFNGSFQRGLFGWQSNDSSKLNFNGKYVHMYGPVSMSTEFQLSDGRCDGEGSERHICFRSSSNSCDKIMICLNSLCEYHLVSNDFSERCISITSAGEKRFELSFSIDSCNLRLGSISGWCHEQNLGVRNVDGSPGPYLGSIRWLNKKLG